MDHSRELFADHLFTGERWLRDARISIDDGGWIRGVDDGASAAGAERRACVVPGVPNLHSHAHQRAMAGLAERSGQGDDTFWTWREAMYATVGLLTPEDMEAVAAQLYVEMLEAGYTAVGEFQYLHHDPAGKPYAELAEMSLRAGAAARRVGIGITHLPVLYAHGGFGGRPAGAGQRRFLNDGERFLRLAEALIAEAEGDDDVAVGIAPHSLRAVSPQLLSEVTAGWGGRGPIHIHIAEQVLEVEDCLAWCGQRPVAWLFDHAAVDEGWCLIHATHMDDTETAALATRGAVAGLCPTTEANLGDGIFRGVDFQIAGGVWGIGSDSHISASPTAELRMLEYSQRLAHRGRNLLAGGPRTSTGRRLLTEALAGGARACGRPIGRLEPGRRADLVALDVDHPRLLGRRGDALLDSWIFSGDTPAVEAVMVGGRWRVEEGRHVDRDAVRDRFRAVVERLAALA